MKEGKMSRSQPQCILTEDKNMLAMAKIKRPQLSNQNPQVFSKLNRREIDPYLVVKNSDEPTGSGMFGNVFQEEYRDVKTVVKQINRRNG